VKARDELEAAAVVADDERDEHALQLDRAGESLHVRVVERPNVLRHANRVERDPTPRLVDGGGHQILLVRARPAGGPIPAHPHARQGVPTSGGGSARPREKPSRRSTSAFLVCVPKRPARQS
jgi:hypothetical protein